MKHLIAVAVVSPICAGLLYWYGHLWFPRLGIAYWSQAIPVAVVAIILPMSSEGSTANKLVTALLGFVFMASLIVQVMVWVSLIQHPNF